jgi:hypothetical protein
LQFPKFRTSYFLRDSPLPRSLPCSLGAILVARPARRIRCWLRGLFATASAASVGGRLSRLVKAAQKRVAVPSPGLAVGNARAHSFLSRCTRCRPSPACNACSAPETRVELGPRTGSQRDSSSAARETDRETPAPASRSGRVRAPTPAPRSTTSSPRRTAAPETICSAQCGSSRCQPHDRHPDTRHREDDHHDPHASVRNPGRQPISPSRDPLKMITEAVATNYRSRLQRLSATSVTRFGEAQLAGAET